MCHAFLMMFAHENKMRVWGYGKGGCIKIKKCLLQRYNSKLDIMIYKGYPNEKI